MIKTNKIRQHATSLASGAMLAASTLTVAFAASDPETIIKNVISSIGGIMTNIFSPLCVLILGIAIVSIVLCKDSKGASTGISWAKRAIIGFVVFNCLGSILTYGQGLFAGEAYTFQITNFMIP